MAGGPRAVDRGGGHKRLVDGAPPGSRPPAPRKRMPRHALLDPDAPSWIHNLSVGMCVLLVCAALVALAFHEPGAIQLRRGELAAPAPALAIQSPTVEPLAPVSPSAAALAARQDQTLAGGLVRDVDVIAAGARPACFGLDPEGDVCLGPGARVRVGALGQGIELLGGRAVVSVERLDFGMSLVVGLGELRVEARDAVLGLELIAGDAAVRVLRGAALVSSGGRADTLMSAHSALYRAAARALEVGPHSAELAQRDWELLAARSARN